MTEEVDLGPYTSGDDKTIGLSFNKSDGSNKPITGWTIFVTVKRDKKESDSEAAFQTDVTSHDDAANGESSFTISASESTSMSGIYVYDIQVKKDDGTVQTYVEGTIEFQDDVTERTS